MSVNLAKYIDPDFGASTDEMFDALPALRNDLVTAMEGGRKVLAADDKGDWYEVKSPSGLDEIFKRRNLDEIESILVFKKGYSPRVLKSIIKGKVLDLSDPKKIPASLKKAMKKEGFDPDTSSRYRDYQYYERSKAVIDWAKRNGFNKIRIPENYETADETGTSVIVLPEAITGFEETETGINPTPFFYPRDASGKIIPQAKEQGALDSSTPSPAQSSAPVSATGLPGVRVLVAQSKLSNDAKFVAGRILDVVERTGLDASALTLELTDALPGERAGSIIGSVIRMVNTADTTILPHEITHILERLLPESDRNAIEQARLANMPANAPESVRAGTMSTQEFIDAGLDRSLYPYINRSEYLAHFFSDKFAKEQLSARDANLMQRVQNWLRQLWEAIKARFKDPAAMDRIYRDLVAGKYAVTPETSIKVEQERGGFQTTREGARTEAEIAQDQTERTISGEDFIAQADAPTKILEKYAVDGLPNSARETFFYNDLKGIQQEGEQLAGAPNTYAALRQRSTPDHNDRRAGMAAQHAIRFDSNLRDVVADAKKAMSELASESLQRRLLRLDKATRSKDIAENAFQMAQVAVQTGINQAFDFLRKENKNDRRIAELQGQIRSLQNVQQSRVALEREMQKIVRVLTSTPQGTAILQNGTSREIESAYREATPPSANDQIVGVASYLLQKIPDLRDQLRAAQLAGQTATMQQAQSAMMGLIVRLKKDPAATLEKIMREREKRASTAQGAEFLFLQLQKELSKELEGLYLRIKQGQIAEQIQKDTDWTMYRDQVLRDQGSFGGKPIEVFKDHNEVLVLPSGKEIGVGSNRIVDSTTEARETVKEFSEAMAELRGWLNDPANLDNPSYFRRQLDLTTLETYYNLFLLQSGQLTRKEIPLLGSALSVLNLVVQDAGTRSAPQVKAAIGVADRLNERVNQWLAKATITLGRTQRAAMRSHRFTGDSARAAKAYDQNVFQELANSHQRQQGGLNVGDRLMSGLRVTREDLNHLEAMSQSGKDLLAIVKEHDRVVLPDEQGLKKGETNYRSELTSSKYIVPRVPRFELAAPAGNVNAVSDSFTRYTQAEEIAARDPSPANQALLETARGNLNSSFSRLWSSVGRSFIAERNPNFANTTIFDGPSGAFKSVADEMRTSPMSFRTFDSVVARISELSTIPEENVRTILLEEFGRIVNQWYTKFAPEINAPKIIGGEPTNSFTKARGNQLAPSPFYRTGWANTDEIRGMAGNATSVAIKRIADGLQVLDQELTTQMEAFDNEASDQRLQGAAKPEAAAKQRKALEQANGKAYSNWVSLDEKRTKVRNAISRLNNGPLERSAWDKIASRWSGAVVGSLIGNSITTFRNLAPIYVARALYKAGFSPQRAILAGFGVTWGKTLQVAGSMGLSGVKGVLWDFMIRGLGDAIINFKGDPSFKNAYKRALKPFIREISTGAAERLRDYREMRDKGIYQVPAFEEEFDHRLSDAMSKGDLPAVPLTAMQKAVVSPAAIFENSLGAIANAVFPTLGDVGVNTGFWWLEHSRFGHSAVFGRKIRSLLTDWKQSRYRQFDFQNPNNPINVISADELNITHRELENLRQTFNHLGTSFDAIAVDYMARLQSDPNAEFLNADQKAAMAEFLLNTANRAAVGNAPQAISAWPKFQILAAPLLNWPLRQLAEFTSQIAVPAELEKSAPTVSEMNKARAAQWAYTTFLTLLGLSAGAISQLSDEEKARLMRYWLYNQESQNRRLWEHDNAGDIAAHFARLGLETVPFVAIGANLAIPQNTPARAAYEPSLVLIEKAKEVNSALTRFWKTGEIGRPALQLLGGFSQDTKIVTSRMEGMTGNRERNNMISMLKRFGPEDLIEPPTARTGSVNANVSRLTPYGPKMINAAFNENRDELQRLYNAAVITARELGRREPEETVAQMYRNGNPIDIAFKSKPTRKQYEDMKKRMSPEQRNQYELGEKKYVQGALALGLRAPKMFSDDSENQSRTRPTSPLRGGRVGMRDLRARAR